MTDWPTITRLLPGYDPWVNASVYEFDEDKADLVVDFFAECLTFIEGAKAGQPFVLEPWQKAFIGNLFGWVNALGHRRYREGILYVGRKNGKTPLAAGIAAYMLLVDDEPGAQIYSAAADRDQAALVYRHAAGMIERDPELRARCRTYKSMKAIERPENVSIYKALSSISETKHGHSVQCALIDELHAHKSRDLVDVLITGTGARTQPLIIHITTADFLRESICNEKYEYGCRVRDSLVADPAFLPAIYEADPKADWTLPATWAQANPNLGVSIYQEYLERQCTRAQESAALENIFKRLHLNIRTETDVMWLDMEKWRLGGDPFDPAMLAGRECYAGLDLATTTDLAALVLLFPDPDVGYYCLPFFWAPEENARKRQTRDRVSYLTWGQAGHIELTDGNTVDYDIIRRRVNELNVTYQIKEIAIDRWNSTQIQTQLMGDGFEVFQFGQGFSSMTAPTKELESLVISGQLQHGGNPVLAWMASNVSVETDAAANLKPSKKKSTEKIDGIVALIMALGRALVADDTYVPPEIMFI